MKRRILNVAIVAVLLLASIITLSACGKKSKSETELPTIEGFKFESVRVFNIEADYYNIEIGLTNTNDEERSFDFSKIIIKKGDLVLIHDGDLTQYDANEYYKWSFQLEYGQDISVGDEVEVFYEDQKITKVTVTEF